MGLVPEFCHKTKYCMTYAWMLLPTASLKSSDTVVDMSRQTVFQAEIEMTIEKNVKIESQEESKWKDKCDCCRSLGEIYSTAVSQ